MTAKGEIVNQAALASIWGVHRNTIAAWVRKGCPYVTKGGKKRGRDWEFDTAQVAQWRIEQAQQDAIGDTEHATEAELDRRKKAADTTIAELNAAKARGELGSIEEFGRQVESLVIEFRQRLLQIPARSAPMLVGLESETEVKAVLADEIEQTLTAVADEHGGD